jgi:hypothetical protein
MELVHSNLLELRAAVFLCEGVDTYSFEIWFQVLVSRFWMPHCKLVAIEELQHRFEVFGIVAMNLDDLGVGFL